MWAFFSLELLQAGAVKGLSWSGDLSNENLQHNQLVCGNCKGCAWWLCACERKERETTTFFPTPEQRREKKCVGEKKNNDGGEQKMKLFKVCLQPAKQVEPRGKPEVAMKEGTKISLEALAFLPEVAGYGTDVVGELAVWTVTAALQKEGAGFVGMQGACTHGMVMCTAPSQFTSLASRVTRTQITYCNFQIVWWHNFPQVWTPSPCTV